MKPDYLTETFHLKPDSHKIGKFTHPPRILILRFTDLIREHAEFLVDCYSERKE